MHHFNFAIPCGWGWIPDDGYRPLCPWTGRPYRITHDGAHVETRPLCAYHRAFAPTIYGPGYALTSAEEVTA